MLATDGIEVRELVRADKHPIGLAEALALVRTARRLVVAKGKQTVIVELAARPSDDELRALVIGPSGNLRAPAIRIGDTLVVGFTADGLRDVLAGR